ncbi:lipoprotein signal peptidase [Vibrionales bacterium SWAT-3]|nr:lipoprotein signal peptidase [Vibrionales bacterium SWAT-3]
MSEVSLKQSGVRWLWLALLVFIADIGIKLFVMDNMGYGWANRIEVLPFFNFCTFITTAPHQLLE